MSHTDRSSDIDFRFARDLRAPRSDFSEEEVARLDEAIAYEAERLAGLTGVKKENIQRMLRSCVRDHTADACAFNESTRGE